MRADTNVKNLYPLETVVVIAGVAMPHERVIVNSAFNTIPTATVSLPPDPRLFGIGRFDRVPIQIFVNNQFTETAEEGEGSELVYLNSYILLFEGDITTFGYSSTKVGREFVVNAHGVLAFLRDIQVEFLTDVQSAFAASLKASGLDKLQNFEFGPVFPLNLFMKGLGGLSTENIIDYPYEYLENVYRFIAERGGATIDPSTGDPPYGTSALSEYYKNYAELIKLLDRYVQVPHFDTAQSWNNNGFPLLSMVRDSVALALIMKKFQDSPRTNSIYDILMFIMQYMEFEVCFLASPTFIDDKLVSSVLKPILYDAHPPKCNVIYAAHCGSIRTEENVYAVPTRIRAFSQYHPLESLLSNTSGWNESLKNLLYNFYPTPTTEVFQGQDRGQLSNIFSGSLLKIESFTGPYVYDTLAPIWLHQLIKGKDDQGENLSDVTTLHEQVLKTMLMMKKYEYRAMSVESAFNPFVTAGFPGIVYDNIDSDLCFCGQVVAVSHNISKAGASTSIEFGFTRSLAEQTSNPLKNSFQPIYDEITSHVDKMTDIYDTILKCDAISYDEAYHKRDDYREYSAAEAYQQNYREICTLGGYAAFIGGTAMAVPVSESSFYGSHILGINNQNYLENRISTAATQDPTAFSTSPGARPSSTELVTILRDVASDYALSTPPTSTTLKNQIYLRDQ